MEKAENIFYYYLFQYHSCNISYIIIVIYYYNHHHH